jgi:transcriptional regulator with XRE-family HTH domain
MLKSSKAAKNDFANRITNLRAQKSLTPSALARSAGVSPAAIWQWEHNGVLPRKPTLAKLAAKLAVTEDFLLTGNASEPSRLSAPSISPSRDLEDTSLEDLIRAIEGKGFLVTLRSKDKD